MQYAYFVQMSIPKIYQTLCNIIRIARFTLVQCLISRQATIIYPRLAPSLAPSMHTLTETHRTLTCTNTNSPDPPKSLHLTLTSTGIDARIFDLLKSTYNWYLLIIND